MWQYIYANELYHYGVKGMKWGVRRTPEQLGHTKKSVLNPVPYYGHKSTPRDYKSYAVLDHMDESGKVKIRSFYNSEGRKYKDIHLTTHGNDKQHNFGEHGEHVLMYEWKKDGTLDKKERRNLMKWERKENSDIL